MDSIKEFFSGKKSILAGLALIGLGAYQLSQGDTAGGTREIVEGFAVIFLRLGITKESAQ